MGEVILRPGDDTGAGMYWNARWGASMFTTVEPPNMTVPDRTYEESTVTPIIVEPGQLQILPVDVDTSHWSGWLSHSDWYTTNDPDLPHFRLTISAEVQPEQ